jgi:hypothetical protein
MAYNGLQWPTMAYNGLQWLTIAYNCQITAYNCLQLPKKCLQLLTIANKMHFICSYSQTMELQAIWPAHSLSYSVTPPIIGRPWRMVICFPLITPTAERIL